MFETLPLRRGAFAIFFYSFAFGLFSLLVSNYLFPSNKGLLAVFISSLAIAYPFSKFLTKQEKHEIERKLSESRLLARHGRELKAYLVFFCGILLAFTIGAIVLPSSFFSIQSKVVSKISGAFSQNLFWKIVANNLSVFAITFLISFFVLAGIVFILVWNASVFGFFIAKSVETLWKIPALFLLYMPHGLLEMAGYTIAGIAGALASYQVDYYFFKGSYKRSAFSRVQLDVLTLLALGIAFIFLAAIIEAI